MDGYVLTVRRMDGWTVRRMDGYVLTVRRTDSVGRLDGWTDMF